MFFFGIFVPLFRGDFLWLLLSLFLAVLTIGVSWFVLPFVYNKIYINRLLSQCFVPADENSRFKLQEKGFLV